MDNPYVGITDEGAIGVIVWNLLKIPTESRKDVLNFARKGYVHDYQREKMKLKGENFATAITTLNRVCEAVGPVKYEELGEASSMYLEIYGKVEAIMAGKFSEQGDCYGKRMLDV